MRSQNFDIGLGHVKKQVFPIWDLINLPVMSVIGRWYRQSSSRFSHLSFMLDFSASQHAGDPLLPSWQRFSNSSVSFCRFTFRSLQNESWHLIALHVMKITLINKRTVFPNIVPFHFSYLVVFYFTRMSSNNSKMIHIIYII